MNKKGQIMILLVMMAIVVFILAVILISPMSQVTIEASNSSNLNCSNPSLPVTNQVVCTVVDMSLFYFISVIIAISIAILTGKNTIAEILQSIFIYILVVSLITPLKYWVNLARTNLSCGTAGITVGAKMLCIVTDLWLFLFVVSAIAAAITYYTARKTQ